MQIKREKILGAPVDVADMTAALAFVDERVRGPGGCTYIVAMNPEKVYALKQDGNLRAFVENAGLIIPDGIGIVWALRMLKKIKTRRVPGVDLMQNICSAAAENGYSIFVMGADEGVNMAAVRKLKQDFPGINIAGRSHGYVPEDKMEDVVGKINDSGAEILLVALGSPRQEKWIAEYMPRLENVRICQGVGGSLDAITGNVKRAPEAIRRLNLEWFYRLLQQPARAGRQLRLLWFAGAVLVSLLAGEDRGSGRNS